MNDRNRLRRAARRVGVAFATSALASMGLMVVYVAGGQPQAEGVLLALSLGGLGYGLVVWGKELLPGGSDVQEREDHTGPNPERDRLEDDLRRDEIPRRSFLGKLLAAAGGMLGLAALFPIRSFGSAPGSDLLHTKWTAGAHLVTAGGEPLTLESLEVGGVVTVFPEGHEGSADSQAIVVRVDESVLDLGDRADWVQDGYVAYSKICTHAGCPVGLYQPQTFELFCPCHQSAFDVRTGAEPITGPATQPLPQLPLDVDADGTLIARGDFSAPVGPAFWRRT